MVIDVARLRVIRQSDPVYLFVCLTTHSTVHKTTGSNGGIINSEECKIEAVV